MNAKLRHKNDTKTFQELSFSEQAKSINAQISILNKAVRAHVRRSDSPNNTLLKCIGQLARNINNLSNTLPIILVFTLFLFTYCNSNTNNKTNNKDNNNPEIKTDKINNRNIFNEISGVWSDEYNTTHKIDIEGENKGMKDGNFGRYDLTVRNIDYENNSIVFDGVYYSEGHKGKEDVKCIVIITQIWDSEHNSFTLLLNYEYPSGMRVINHLGFVRKLDPSIDK
jgi:hypothetical protein